MMGLMRLLEKSVPLHLWTFLRVCCRVPRLRIPWSPEGEPALTGFHPGEIREKTDATI